MKGCNVQRTIKMARRAFRAAGRRLRRCWTGVASRLRSAVRNWRLGKSATDGRNATGEREAA